MWFQPWPWGSWAASHVPSRCHPSCLVIAISRIQRRCELRDGRQCKLPSLERTCRVLGAALPEFRCFARHRVLSHPLALHVTLQVWNYQQQAFVVHQQTGLALLATGDASDTGPAPVSLSNSPDMYHAQ